MGHTVNCASHIIALSTRAGGEVRSIDRSLIALLPILPFPRDADPFMTETGF
jgi:hypothetical protein